MALCLAVSAALLHATGLGKRRWTSPFLAVKTACNFNLCKNFRLECFQSVLYETEASGTLWLLLGVNGTWWCFLLFKVFFFLRERERVSCGQLSVQCCWLKNGGKLFCWWCLPIRVNCLITIKVFCCFVCYVFECRRLEVKRRGIQSSWTNTTTTIFLPYPIVCSCFSRALTAECMDVCILH